MQGKVQVAAKMLGRCTPTLLTSASPQAVAPVESRGRSLPRFIRLPSGSTMLCAGTPSAACQKILDKTNPSSAYDDEDWAYGDGAYAEYADIDEYADTGVISMPYDVRLGSRHDC